jgi:uncharacterized protein YbjT (DUF2867 family)
MKALIIGATGATGTEVLELILKDETYKQVAIFVRREVDLKHDKLKVHIIDFDKPEQWKTLVKGDVLFSCLGTTLKTVGSKEAQWKIDYGYQYDFAKIAQENDVNNYVLISTSNASAKSFFFYAKMKGQLEEAIKALKFSKLIIFNPTLLIRENTDRKMEIIGAKVITFFNKLGLFRSQKPISTKVLAKAMIKSVKVLDNGQHAIEGQNILDYA